MKLKEAKIIANKFANSLNKKLAKAFEVERGFVFLLENKKRTKDIVYDNPYIIVEKTTGKIDQYSPLMNPKEFKKASKINLLEGIA